MNGAFLSTLSEYHIFDLMTVVFGTVFTIWLKKGSKSKGSEQLASYVPTLWTSLGILFTFVSIYLSLSIAGKKDAFDIKELINNIIPAFSTSIIGIIGAIITTLINKWSIAKQECSENEKFQQIKRQYCGDIASDTPELMLLEIEKSIEEFGSRTCGKLDVGKSSSDQKLDALLAKCANVLSLIAECNKKSIEALSDEFKATKAQLSSGNSNIINAVNSSLQMQNKSFEDQVKALSERFESTINATQRSFVDTINLLTTSIDGKMQVMVDSNKKILEDTVELQGKKLEFIKEKLIDESKTRNEQLEQFTKNENEELKNFITSQGETYRKLYESINEQITSHINREADLFENDIKQTIEEFAKTQYETSVSTIEECTTKLVETSKDALKNQNDATDNFISELKTELTSSLQSLVGQMDKLSSNMADKLQEIHDIETGLIEDTIKDNQSNVKILLDENKKEISSVKENIASNNTGFIESLDSKLGEWMNKLGEMSIKLNTEVTQIATKSSTNIQSIKESIEGVAVSLNRLVVSVKTDIDNLVGNFKTGEDEVQKHLLENTKTLSGDISQQIHDSFNIQQLEEACSRLSLGINNCIADIQSKIDIINGHLDKVSQSVKDSSEMYVNAVEKSDVINKYIDGTTSLFKLHKDVVETLNESLTNIESSVNRLREQLQDLSSSRMGANTPKSPHNKSK